MSAPKSRLDTLLRVRRIEEEGSRGRLAAAAASERGAQHRLGQAHKQYAEPASEPASVAQTVPGFMGHRRHRDALAAAVLAAGTGVDAAAQVTVLARQCWSVAAMRMTALERLDERTDEELRRGRLAADQRTSDECIEGRFGREGRDHVRRK